jgi:hypothetical protein
LKESDAQGQPQGASSSESRLKEIGDMNEIMLKLSNHDEAGRGRILDAVLTYFGHAPAPGRSITSGSAASARQQPLGESGTARTQLNAQTPKEFMAEKQPLKDVERVACLGYFLAHYRDQAHFKTIDLTKLNTEAAQKTMSNPAQAVKNAGTTV